MALHKFIYVHPSGERIEVYMASEYATRRALKYLRAEDELKHELVRDVTIVPAQRSVGSDLGVIK